MESQSMTKHMHINGLCTATHHKFISTHAMLDNFNNKLYKCYIRQIIPCFVICIKMKDRFLFILVIKKIKQHHKIIQKQFSIYLNVTRNISTRIIYCHEISTFS